MKSATEVFGATEVSPSIGEVRSRNRVANWLLLLALANCIFQLSWFASKCFNEIDFDGMAYLGVARHLRDGNFHAAINAFRSPLISWLIAAASFVNGNYVHVGKVVSIASFFACFVLLFVFTDELWRSRLVASAAVLMFSFARGFTASAVTMVTPDFLFAAIVLVYFIVLVRCLREEKGKKWFLLGGVHALAFLAKAFALPWLAISTSVAVGLSKGQLRAKTIRLLLAAIMPIVVAATWAMVIHSRYGVFTTGTQFKANLLQWTLKAYRDHHETAYSVLVNTKPYVDEYVIDDPMPPDSWPWAYKVNAKVAAPKVIAAERKNIPHVLKEIVIVSTPGGIIAFIATIVIVSCRNQRTNPERVMLAVIGFSALTLVGAYSMLVFDARYLFPLIPLVLAVAARFLIPDLKWNHRVFRRVALALALLGTLVALTYSSSPFRTLTRDFQVPCYEAGQILKRHSGSTLVSIGSGPFPERGVGWEAGYTAAYFGNRWIIAALDRLPPPEEVNNTLGDIRKATPDAVVVWGKAQDIEYLELTRSLSIRYPHATSIKVYDASEGEVASVLLLSSGS